MEVGMGGWKDGVKRKEGWMDGRKGLKKKGVKNKLIYRGRSFFLFIDLLIY